MDPLTHYLSAKLTQNLFLKDMTRRHISLFALAAVFPDIDYVTRAFGMATYLKYHRGITHSFVGIAILSAGLAYLFSIHEKGNFKYLFSIAYLSMFIHIMFDWTNSYGTQLFLPFSDHRAALDAVFIIDIYILAIFTVALIVIAVLKQQRYNASLVFTLITLTYIVSKIVFNQLVICDIKKLPVEGKKVSVAAFPGMFAVNRFKSVIETKDSYYTLDYYMFNDDDKFKNMTEHKKMKRNELMDVVDDTYLGKVFLGFARYPLYSIEKDGKYTLVRITDIRYRYRREGHEGFTAKFWVDDDMKVVKDSFRF